MTSAIDARDVLNVERPEASLVGVAEHLFGWSPAPHHLLWAQEMERLARGEIPDNRLLIVAPPAHAKTNWGGIALPAWFVGHNPYKHVLYFSATATQSARSSTAVRDTIAVHPKWKEFFPDVKPDAARWASSSWTLARPNAPGDKDPTMFAASVGSQSVLGARGDLLIFDDVSTQENTRTKLRRESIKDWIEQTAFTRSTSDTMMMGIMTRWHSDDIAGYFEREHGFTVIHMPANGYWESMAAPMKASMDGEPLWPEQYPSKFLITMRNSIGDYKYTATYQGNPTAPEGAILREEYLGPYSIPFSSPIAQDLLRKSGKAQFPPYNAVVTASHEVMTLKMKIVVADTSLKDQDNASYTVFAVWGVGLDGQAYLLDVWRKHIDAVDLFDVFLAYYREHDPRLALIEDRASGIQLIQNIQRKTAITVQAISPAQSKEERLRVQVHVIKGAFHIPNPDLAPEAEWIQEFLDEHLEFPRGSHDDQVDTTSMAAEFLEDHVTFFTIEDEDAPIRLPDQVQHAASAGQRDGAPGALAGDEEFGVPSGRQIAGFGRDEWMR